MARNAILVQEITNSVLRNPDALISVARLKTADNYTYMHSVAVSALMVALAKQLGFDEAKIHQAAMAGLLHDIGKAQSNLQHSEQTRGPDRRRVRPHEAPPRGRLRTAQAHHCTTRRCWTPACTTMSAWMAGLPRIACRAMPSPSWPA